MASMSVFFWNVAVETLCLWVLNGFKQDRLLNYLLCTSAFSGFRTSATRAHLAAKWRCIFGPQLYLWWCLQEVYFVMSCSKPIKIGSSCWTSRFLSVKLGPERPHTVFCSKQKCNTPKANINVIHDTDTYNQFDISHANTARKELLLRSL